MVADGTFFVTLNRMTTDITLDNITALAKRRGFIYPSSEIYGGLANTYDFGPYGTELKENVRRLWWDRFVRGREDMYGIDSSIIINRQCGKQADMWQHLVM